MHRPHLSLLAVAGLTGLVATAALASDAAAGGKKSKAKKVQVQYVGVHPIAAAHGGGLCHIELPHVHVYQPSDARVQYRVHDDAYFFVGDPVAYGWDGDRHAYYGHHPIEVDVVVGGHDHTEYCYLDGAHYHAYTPPPEVAFEVRAGAYWYVGDVPEVYLEGRATYDPIDVVYEPIAYERPVVVVDAPPPQWIGVSLHAHVPAVVVDAPAVVVEAPHAHGHVRAGVEVVAPSLEIEIGVPVLSVEIGGHAHGGVIVGHDDDDDHHRHGKKRWKKGKQGWGHHKGRRGRKRWH